MIVVDRIQKKVLDVPTKCGKLHTCVHPRKRDSANLLLFLIYHLKQGSFRLIEIIEVEKVSFIFKIGI